MITLSIEDERSKDGKGRQFRAVMLGYIRADMLWDGGQAATENLRPIYAMFGGSEAALRPFLANVRKGRKVYALKRTVYREERDGRVEFLKSAGYEYMWQRGKGMALVTAYLPELFQADPGMINHQLITFISAPPRWWVDAQGMKLPAADVDRVQSHLRRLGVGRAGGTLPLPVSLTDESLRQLIPAAAHFCLYLDKRTRRPLINDLSFSVQLYLSSLHLGVASFDASIKTDWGAHNWATRGSQFCGYGLPNLGFYPPVVVNVSQDDMDRFLAEQIKLWRNPHGN